MAPEWVTYGTAPLRSTACIGLTSNGVPNAPARLVCTNTICKIIIKRPKGVCAIITHPRAAGTGRNRKLNTTVDRRNTNRCIILIIGCRMCGSGGHSEKDRKERKERLPHLYVVSNALAFRLLFLLLHLFEAEVGYCLETLIQAHQNQQLLCDSAAVVAAEAFFA